MSRIVGPVTLDALYSKSVTVYAELCSQIQPAVTTPASLAWQRAGFSTPRLVAAFGRCQNRGRNPEHDGSRQTMCTALIAYRSIPGFDLVVAHNRDELYGRAAVPAEFWSDHPEILAGRDLESRGTWLGVSRTARVGLVTNFRREAPWPDQRLSRGNLVVDFLTGRAGSRPHGRRVHISRESYRPFSAVFVDAERCWFVSSESEDTHEITPGFHGLSNHLLNTPWPKVTRGVAALRSLGERFRDSQDTDALVESLFRELRDDRSAAGAEATRGSPDAAVSEDDGAAGGLPLSSDPRESIFVRTADYGTRASTVVLLATSGVVRFAEQCWDANGARLSRRDFQWDFRINSDGANPCSL